MTPASEPVPSVVCDSTLASTARPRDEAAKLGIVGSADRRDAFARALDVAARSDGARRRDAYRTADELAGRGRSHEYVFVPDLNRALGFLIGRPRVAERSSKTILQGRAEVMGQIRDVDVVFDPIRRYVTVQPPGGEGDRRYYYTLRMDDRGVLRIRDQPPLRKNEVYKNLADTHFAY